MNNKSVIKLAFHLAKLDTSQRIINALEVGDTEMVNALWPEDLELHPEQFCRDTVEYSDGVCALIKDTLSSSPADLDMLAPNETALVVYLATLVRHGYYSPDEEMEIAADRIICKVVDDNPTGKLAAITELTEMLAEYFPMAIEDVLYNNLGEEEA